MTPPVQCFSPPSCTRAADLTFSSDNITAVLALTTDAFTLACTMSLSILLLTFDLDVEAEYYDINGSTPLLESTYHMSGFTTGGNGFIATWAGTLCAFKFAYNEFVGGTLNLTGIVRNSISLRYQETTMQPADV